MKSGSKIPGIIMIVSGILLCVVDMFVPGLILVLVGIFATASAQPQKTAQQTTTQKKSVPRVKNVRSGVDCYSFNGTVEEYFAGVLRRNFPAYEVRTNAAPQQLNSASGFQSVPAPVSSAWSCSCGTCNTGKFCSECGAKRPSDPVSAPVSSASPVSVDPNSKYTPLSFVLYQNGSAKLGIIICGKRDYDCAKTFSVLERTERCCKKQGVPCQRYYREFRNDEAYIRSRISQSLR